MTPEPVASQHNFIVQPPWLPKIGMQRHFSIYIVDYSLQEPHLIL